MIIYDLQCDQGHTFEGWFEDSEAFASQEASGLLTCPICNSTRVSRIPSTFAIKGAGRRPPAAPPPDARILARALSEYMENNFDNVGADFASEALKIHYGAAEPRNIRGVSTPMEEDMLRQEGVDFFKFPVARTDPDEPQETPESKNN